MAPFKNAMEVFKLLDKTNCRKCNKPTCLAFAVSVFQGQIALSQCPFIDEKILNAHGHENNKDESAFGQDYQQQIERLKEDIKQIDLESRAHALGGKFLKDRLILKILGKDFGVDKNGDFYTDIHVNFWITPPVLNYIIHGQGLALTGTWVPFRELENAKNWSRFFEHQCVGLFKKVADSNPSFFKDIIELFNGKPVENHYEADVSLIIYPLPLLPILICYNHPEDGLDSDLNLFFDRTADKNLPPENIYTLGTGLATMFKKLGETHG